MTLAIGLLSGGLDSILAVQVIREQGIVVVGVSFVTPFFNAEAARTAARGIGIPLEVLDITETHLTMLRHPKHGYGRGMNPCIDCHTLMLREAGGLMEREGGVFLVTGEVLGQRPMSQHKGALRIVERESGYEGRILRPLSAQLLPATVPEQEGLIDRERLLAISGRSRRQQLELARRYQITEYLTPAGGCLLTDPIFSRRLKDLFAHEDPPEVRGIELLKVGRHLRLTPEAKMVVGRHALDNERIAQLAAPDDDLLKVEGFPGPLCLIPHGGSGEEIQLAAGICVRYGDTPKGTEVIVIRSRGGEEEEIRARSCPQSLPAELMI
jgi:tRNA-specific 2-thiouridylase